jgi:hypothetical protein
MKKTVYKKRIDFKLKPLLKSKIRKEYLKLNGNITYQELADKFDCTTWLVQSSLKGVILISDELKNSIF